MKFFLTAVVLSSIATIAMAATSTSIRCTSDIVRDQCAASISIAPTRFELSLRRGGQGLGSLISRKSTVEDCNTIAEEFKSVKGCEGRTQTYKR